MKRLLSILLAVVMITGTVCTVPVSAEEPAKELTETADVSVVADTDDMSEYPADDAAGSESFADDEADIADDEEYIPEANAIVEDASSEEDDVVSADEADPEGDATVDSVEIEDDPVDIDEGIKITNLSRVLREPAINVTATIPYNGELDHYSIIYLVAENATTRFYLAKEKPDSTTVEFTNVPVRLVPGEYSLRVIKVRQNETTTTTTASKPYDTKIYPIGTPVITKVVPQKDGEKGAVYVKTPDKIEKIENAIIIDSTSTSVGAWFDIEGEESRIETDLGTGEYTLRYDGTGVSSGVLYISSGAVSFYVPKEASLTSISSCFRDGVYSLAFMTARYIGATDQIYTSFTSSDFRDKRLSYKSDNTKVATVDSAGLVKAVGKGTAHITVTSVADPTITTSVEYTVNPFELKTFKFEETKITKDLNPKTPTATFDLYMKFDSDFSATHTPIDFTVTGDGGLQVNTSPLGNGPWALEYSATPVMDDSTQIGIKLQALAGGVYEVKATSIMGKTAVCKVIINGYTDQRSTGTDPVKYYQTPTASSQFYLNGKKVTGWIGFDHDANKWLTGKDVLNFKGKPNEILRRDIHYIDPKTGRPIDKGVHRIDKKLYAFSTSDTEAGILAKPFDDAGTNAADEKKTIFNPEKGDYSPVWVSKSGPVMTGWISDIYYSPSTGYPVSNGWVPYKTGRTWVNKDGMRLDKDGHSLDADDLWTLPDGGKYYFKGGMVHTGWLYINSSNNPSTVKGTEDKGRCYMDPASNGRLCTHQFALKGKTYRPDSTGKILIPSVCNSKAKYVCVRDGTKRWINDSTGAVVKNKLVDAAEASYPSDPSYGKIHTMYADADGYVVESGRYKIKGKYLSFDGFGYLNGEKSELKDFYVLSGGTKVSVYEKVDKNGVVSFEADGVKVKNAVLYEGSNVPTYVADNSGAIASDTVIKARPDIKSSKTYMYLVSTDRKIVIPTQPAAAANGEPVYGRTEYKHNYYAINKDGQLAVNTLAIVETSKNGSGEWVALDYAYATKNGALVCSKIQNIKGIGRVAFEGDGDDIKDYGIRKIGGKTYFITNDSKQWVEYKGYSFLTFPKRSKGEYAQLFGYRFYMNTDGTMKLGWISHVSNGSRMYWADNGNTTSYLSSGTMIYGTPMMYRIGGKLYLFNYDGDQVTGWVKIPYGYVYPVKNAKWSPDNHEEKQDLICYFDPETGAAVTGWQDVPLPIVVDGEFSLGCEDLNANVAYRIETASEKGKLYFDSDGNLVRNKDLTIGRKLYVFGEDGKSFVAGGWSDDRKLYAGGKGKLLTGRQKIDGKNYYFDKAEAAGVFCQLRKTGKKWYYYDDTGMQATPAMGEEGIAYDGGSTYYTKFMSTSGRKLKTLWNKDGSLKKIVYADTGKPAAGESVIFGVWPYDSTLSEKYLKEGRNGYVLDAAGLPKTGLVSDFSLGGKTRYSMLRDKDGAPLTGGSDGLSLVKYGKKYYVMDQGLVYSGHAGPCEIKDWSALSEKDRKVMDFYKTYTAKRGWKLFIIIWDDGSVAANTYVFSQLDEENKGMWHTGCLGVPMDRYYPLYKVGKKWYVSGELLQSREFEYAEGKIADIRVKSNGELIGFYDRNTGKPANCKEAYEPSMMLRLKNGKPVTGAFVRQGYNYYLPPEIGIYLRWGI